MTEYNSYNDTITGTSNVQSTENKPQPAEARIEVGNGGTSIQMGPTGMMETTADPQPGWVSGSQEVAGSIMSTARNEQGMPITDRPIRGDDLVSFQGITTSATVAAGMGMMTTDIFGNFIATEQGNQQAGSPERKQAEAKVEEAKAEAEGAAEHALKMPEGDAQLVNTIISATSQGTKASIVLEASETGDVSDRLAEVIAGEMGTSAEVAAATMASTKAAYFNAAHKVIEAEGGDVDGMADWIATSGVLESQRREAIEALVANSDTRPMRALAAAYVSDIGSHNPERAEAFLRDNGLEPRRSMGGAVFADFPGHGELSWREAVERRIITRG